MTPIRAFALAASLIPGGALGVAVATALAVAVAAPAQADTFRATADPTDSDRTPLGPGFGRSDGRDLLGFGEGELKLPPVGLGMGGAFVDPEGDGQEGYATLRMGAEFKVWRLAVGLNFYLRVDDDFALREEDWDETSDIPRFIEYVEFGSKRDILHARVGRLHNAYLRHGTLLGRFESDIDYDSPKVGAVLDLNLGWFGVETLTDNIFGFDVSGVAAYVKPLHWTEWPFVKDMAVGATAVADRDAPRMLDFREDGTVEVDRDGNLEYEGEPVYAVGLDVEVPLLENWLFRLTPYADFNYIVDYGTGEHLGAEFVFNLDIIIPVEISARAEYRFLQAQYLPVYFDTFYEIDRYRYPDLDSPTTKLQALEDADENHGVFGEARVRIPKWAAAYVAYEVYEDEELSQFAAGVEVTGFDFIKARVRYVKRAISQGDDLLDFDDHTFLKAELLLRIYDFIYLSFDYTRTWRVDRDTGEYEPVDSYEPGVVFVVSF